MVSSIKFKRKSDDFRLGSLNIEVYTGGLQLVINLKSRQLTHAEKSLLSNYVAQHHPKLMCMHRGKMF